MLIISHVRLNVNRTYPPGSDNTPPVEPASPPAHPRRAWRHPSPRRRSDRSGATCRLEIRTTRRANDRCSCRG